MFKYNKKIEEIMSYHRMNNKIILNKDSKETYFVLNIKELVLAMNLIYHIYGSFSISSSLQYSHTAYDRKIRLFSLKKGFDCLGGGLLTKLEKKSLTAKHENNFQDLIRIIYFLYKKKYNKKPGILKEILEIKDLYIKMSEDPTT